MNSILNSETRLSNSERNFLKTLSKFENIPRKKAKFLNFVRTAVPQKPNSALVDSVWNIMETAYKENIENTTEKQQQANGKYSSLRVSGCRSKAWFLKYFMSRV